MLIFCSLTIAKFQEGALTILVFCLILVGQKFLPDIRKCENTATRKKVVRFFSC